MTEREQLPAGAFEAFDRGIRFTQYLRPHGHPVPVWIDMPAPVEEMAKAVVAAGGIFEIEVLTTGQVSMSVEKRGYSCDDHVAELCPNDAAVPDAVERLVRRAHARLLSTECQRCSAPAEEDGLCAHHLTERELDSREAVRERDGDLESQL